MTSLTPDLTQNGPKSTKGADYINPLMHGGLPMEHFPCNSRSCFSLPLLVPLCFSLLLPTWISKTNALSPLIVDATRALGIPMVFSSFILLLLLAPPCAPWFLLLPPPLHCSSLLHPAPLYSSFILLLLPLLVPHVHFCFSLLLRKEQGGP